MQAERAGGLRLRRIDRPDGRLRPVLDPERARVLPSAQHAFLSIARRSVGMVLYSQSMRRSCVTRG